MTKEPIMIDGVDVSKCKHFNCDTGYNPETEEFVKGACECIAAHDSYGEFMYYGICKERDCYYKQLKRKEQECEMLKRYLNEIRYEELSQLDIEWDEYETSARKEDYSNIITLVERALGEIDV